MRTEEDLQAYFAEQLKPEEQTYFAVAWDVIPGDDLGTILRESDLVLKVKVGEQFIIGADRVSHYVTVTSFLKGDVELWEKVTIPFPFDSVKEGDECIVSLWNPGPGLLVFSSRNSLYDLSMEEEIRSILAAQAE